MGSKGKSEWSDLFLCLFYGEKLAKTILSQTVPAKQIRKAKELMKVRCKAQISTQKFFANDKIVVHFKAGHNHIPSFIYTWKNCGYHLLFLTG